MPSSPKPTRTPCINSCTLGNEPLCSIIVHRARPSTKDVDGWFSNPQAVRLAAKRIAAARSEEDTRDIRFLANHLHLDTAEGILEIVLRYYPEDRLPVRTRLLIEEIFE